MKKLVLPHSTQDPCLSASCVGTGCSPGITHKVMPRAIAGYPQSQAALGKVWVLWRNSPSTHDRAKSEFYRWAHCQNKPKGSVCKVSNSHYVRATPFCLCWAFCTKSEQMLLSRVHDQLVFFPLQNSSPKGSSTSFLISGKDFFHFCTSFQISYCTAQVLHTLPLNS